MGLAVAAADRVVFVGTRFATVDLGVGLAGSAVGHIDLGAVGQAPIVVSLAVGATHWVIVEGANAQVLGFALPLVSDSHVLAIGLASAGKSGIIDSANWGVNGRADTAARTITGSIVGEGSQRSAVGLAAVLVSLAIESANGFISVVARDITENFGVARLGAGSLRNNFDLSTLGSLALAGVVPTVRTADGRGRSCAETVSYLAIALVDDFNLGAFSQAGVGVIFAVLTANRIQIFWAGAGGRGRRRRGSLAIAISGEFSGGLAHQFAQIVVSLSVSTADIGAPVRTLGVANSHIFELLASPLFGVGRVDVEALSQTPILESVNFADANRIKVGRA